MLGDCGDDTHIYVGDYTMIGPNVTIATASHPISPKLREEMYQYNLPVTIGRCCWIGAVGNPCKVLRQIIEEDWRPYYYEL